MFVDAVMGRVVDESVLREPGVVKAGSMEVYEHGP